MNNQLVSSSSSSSSCPPPPPPPLSINSTPSWRYDVFLSFRGVDTRNNFTDHLYKALVDKGIDTFIDDQLRRGEEISLALLRAIEESRISLVIFSKTYASSSWCLDELVKILQCRESKQQIVLPVFYKVNPSHVRNRTSRFGDAFTELECKFKDNKEKILAWKSALREVANLSGHPFRKGDSETAFISNIVEEISVQVLDRTYLYVAKYPVGIQSCVQELKKLLGDGGNGRRVAGIWGTSGIGKTTIAKAVYNAMAHKFEGRCFLADVRETAMQHDGLLRLQNTILSEINRDSKWKAVNTHRGISLIEKLLRRKKILLILDDVDELAQLNNLVEVDWFGEGSRLIITTKNRGLLESYGVELIYEVQKLKDGKALELFSLNAFGRKEPPDDYWILAVSAIAHAQGLPLALNLMGSHLRNKSINRWQAILDNYDSYEGEPYRGIQAILWKSYNAWDYVLQQVFLDIACFFKGEHKDYVLQILRSSKLNVPQDCIEVLVENAIITIEDDRILMHDLLEKMGKRIVWEESPTEPGKRSRVWHHEDVYQVLTENKGTEKIKRIVVMLPQPNVIPLNAESVLKMVNLELFINRNACFSGCVDYLPNNLRWFDLGGRSEIKHTVVFNLPSNYNPRHLVKFDVSYSGIRQLKGFKNSTNLTSMNFSGCEFLEQISDLSGIPNIRELNLSECTSLVEVDDSVGFLDKLVSLDISGCTKLTRFATRLGLKSLQWLNLRGCARLESFPEIEEDKMESLYCLEIDKSGIRELPSSIAYLTGIIYFRAEGCMLQNLHRTFGKKVKFDEVSSCSTKSQLFSNHLNTSDYNSITFTLPMLQKLYLNGCNLSESDFLVPLDCDKLEILDLSGNNFVSLPDCISKFVNLKLLYLSGCKRLWEIPRVLPPKLRKLHLNDCGSLEKIPKLPPMLGRLELINCFRLSCNEVAKLENNSLSNRQEPLRRSELDIIYPGNEVPKWFSYTSYHPTKTNRTKLPQKFPFKSFVGGSEFSFEIPLNLQVGETLLGLALSSVFEPPTYCFRETRILINGKQKFAPHMSYKWDMKATHVRLALVDLDEQEQHGDICQVIFQCPRGARIKSCGVHPLLRNQDKRLHLSLGPTTSLGKRRSPNGSSDDIVDGQYDQKQQWPPLYSEPADDHLKHRQIDLNVPIEIEEEEEEQEQPSTSDDPQFLIF